MEAPLMHLALVGTPNSGKTALFNALTGSRQKVANYPGVTVERKQGSFVTPQGRQVSLVDLPGTYSLRGRSPDEEITRDIVLGRSAGESLSLMMIDVDDFKLLNDTIGHAAGDEFLRSVGQLIKSTMRDNDIAFRYGGDEFVILSEHTTCADDTITVADEALSTLGQPFIVDGHQLSISASIGVVERRIADTDPSEMLRAPSITLHWAKADGKARWTLFDADRNQREVARYTLSAAMPYALERDEFALDYQPLVDLADGTVR